MPKRIYNMDNYIILNIKNDEIEKDPALKDILVEHSLDCFVKHSDLAVETFTLIFNAIDLIITLLSHPYILQLIDAGKITVIFNGFELTNNWKLLVKDICKDPYIKNEFIKAFKQNTISIKGQSSNASHFYNEIKSILGLNDINESK